MDSSTKNCPAGVGHCGWPTPAGARDTTWGLRIGARNTTWPSRISVAVRCSRSTFSQVWTACSELSALDGTHPVTLLGSWARRISVQPAPVDPAVSASVSTTVEVPQNVPVRRYPTPWTLETGDERTAVARATNA